MQPIEGNLKHLGWLGGHYGQVTWLAVGQTQGTEFVVSGAKDAKIIKWKLHKSTDERGHAVTGSLDKINNVHSDTVNDLWLAYDGWFLLSASDDMTWSIWNMERGTTYTTCEEHCSEVISVAFGFDDRIVISADSDSIIKISNILGEVKFSHNVPSLTCLRLAPITEEDGRVMYAYGSTDGSIWIFNTKIGEPEYVLNEHTARVTSINFSKCNNYMVSSGRDCEVIIWDVNNGYSKRTYFSLTVHPFSLKQLVFL